MRGFFTWVTNHPWIVLFLSLSLTVAVGYGLKDLQAETDVRNMLPEGYPSVVHTFKIAEIFEIDENIAIAVINEGDGGIYNAHTLSVIDQITARLKDVKGIETSKIFSLFSVSDIVGSEEGFSVVPLCENVPQSASEIQALSDRVDQNVLYHGSLVSKDKTGTLVTAAVTPVADKARVYFDVMDMLDTVNRQGETFYVAGGPVVQGVIGIHVNQDMSRMMPLVSVVIVLMLLLIFRTLRGVVLPLAVVMLSVIWSMGIMAWCGIPLYAMTTIVPIVIMAIGVADGIHILARYNEGAREHPDRSSKEVAVNALMEMASPVIMTSLTTAIGFLSLLTSHMKPIFYTGVFTAVGVLVAMVFSLTLIPALLGMMRLPKQARAKKRGFAMENVFSRSGALVFGRRVGVLAVAAVIVIGSLGALFWVEVDSDPMANFNQSDPIPISTKVINRLFSGAMTVHTTLESDREKRFIEPDALLAMDAYQREVLAIDEVGAVVSVVDLLKMMHRAMNGGTPENFVVPPDRNLVGTYLLLYSGDNINHFINYGRDHVNIQTQVATTSTKTLDGVLEKMEAIADRTLRPLPDVRVNVGGLGRVVVDLINIIVYGQVYSILLSIVGVFIITSLMFRSPVAGLFNIVPISVATAFNFGIMGVLGIPLEPATAITSCIGIGVGIDYAIHFIAKYRLTRHSMEKGSALTQAVMATAGRAIFYNAVVVIGGFLVLLASQFPPSRHMGMMISLNMFTSFLASVTVLPALLVALDPKFCRR